MRMDCAESAERRHVVIAKDCGWRFGQSQELFHCKQPAFGFAVSVSRQLRQERYVSHFKRSAITGEPLGVRLKTKLISDVGDAPVSESYQMLGSLTARRRIIDHHRMHEFSG